MSAKRKSGSSRVNVSKDIHLSPLRRDDAPALVEFLNDRDIYRATLQIPYPYSDEDAERFINSVYANTEQHGHPVHFAIRDRDQKAVGVCGFESIAYGHSAEIGYWLARPLWGRGIMTDVVRVMVQFVLTEWKLVRVTAQVFSFNSASARLLEKNGFQLEGLLRKKTKKDEKFIDVKLYAYVVDDK